MRRLLRQLIIDGALGINDERQQAGKSSCVRNQYSSNFWKHPYPDRGSMYKKMALANGGMTADMIAN